MNSWFALRGAATTRSCARRPWIGSPVPFPGSVADGSALPSPRSPTTVRRLIIFRAAEIRVQVSIVGLTITGGSATSTVGGGIANHGTLTVTDSTFKGNLAVFGG